jgi:hypothetical protein
MALCLAACADANCSGHLHPTPGATYADVSTAPRPAGVPQAASVLYIYRIEQRIGCAVAPSVSIAGKPVFDIENGSFTKLYIMPGHYHIRSTEGTVMDVLNWSPGAALVGQKQDRDRDFDIAPGRAYFLMLDQLFETTFGAAVVGNTAVPDSGFRTIRDQWTFEPEESARPVISALRSIPSKTLLIGN